MKIHPSDLLLEEVLASEASADDRSELLIHLAACSRCRARLRDLPAEARRQIAALAPTLLRDPRPSAPLAWVPVQPPPMAVNDPALYGAALDRSERSYLARATAMRRERGEAPGLLAELLAQGGANRRLLLANSPRFHTWGVYELALEQSWLLRFTDPRQADDLAHLALDLSAHLDAENYTAELIEDLRGRAWAFLGNLRRIASDLEGADRAFETCYEHLKKGTREPMERAIFLELKAALRRYQRRFDEAMRLFNRAGEIFLRHGDRHRAGRSLVGLSLVHESMGDAEQAIKILHQALGMIDPAADPELLLSAHHNQIFYLTSLGRFIEAQGLYRKTRHLFERLEARAFAHRRCWVKGQIERGLGQWGSAEKLFLQARQGFLEEQIAYEAALISLDLASLYAEQKRTAELKQLAAEALPVFSSLGIQREALAALIFMKQAADAERLSVQMTARIMEFLRRAQADPSIQFEAAAIRFGGS